MDRSMKITKVCCQGCGANLDIGEGIRFVTCNHCGSRLEVVHDSSVTHTRLLEKIEQATQKMAGNLKVIELQNDLELLDRDWTALREKFLVRNKDGSDSEPGALGSIAGGIVGIVVGLIWMVGTASVLNEAGEGGFVALFPLFGLLVIGFSIYGIVSGTSKAGAFNEAKTLYENRRSRLLAEIRSEKGRSS